MAVRFILGRSGSGKTHTCLDMIAESLLQEGQGGGPLVLLLPEQATYQAERAILAREGIRGYSRLRILSFNRLAFHLLGSSGGTDLNRWGQTLLIQKLLRQCADQFEVYGQTASTFGFANQMAGFLTELHHQAYDVTSLQTQLETLEEPSLIQRKLKDVLTLFKAYEATLNDPSRPLNHADRQLGLALQRIPEARWLQGARLWVDGFAGFTEQEWQVLGRLLSVCQETYFALCLDPETVDQAPNPHGLFKATEETYVRLKAMCQQAHLDLAPPITLSQGPRFRTCPDLAYLETNLYTESSTSTAPPAEHIHLRAASHRRSEITWVGQEIKRLVREQNLRYRDIAVIVSDLPVYQSLLDSLFTEMAIPFFLDVPHSLAHHPVVELIVAGLQAAREGFPTRHVLAYLKTGLGPLSDTEIHQLENACLEYGIGAQQWTQAEAWNFPGSKDLDTLRKKAIKPLQQLARMICFSNADHPMTAASFVQGLWSFLKALQVPQRLASWCEEAPETAFLHQQMLDQLVELLDTLVLIYDDTCNAGDFFADLLVPMLNQLTVKQIPPCLDQVLVGSIERSRHPDIKAAFLVGVTQRQFPIPLSDDGLLTDSERQSLKNQGWALREGQHQQLQDRPYLSYIALTRPSQYLALSYAQRDERGGAVMSASVMNRLCDLFPGLTIQNTGTADWASIASWAGLEDRLCDILGRSAENETDEDRNQAQSILTELSETTLGQRVHWALQYRNQAVLQATTRDQLWSGPLTCSPARLRSFAECPYRHFVRYGLRLKTRPVLGLEPVDIGSLYHAVLEQVFKDLQEEHQTLADVQDADCATHVNRAFDTVVQRDRSVQAFAAGSVHQAFLLETARGHITEATRDLAELSRMSHFVQAGAEVGFGLEQSLPGLHLTSAQGQSVTLTGTMDRIDLYQDPRGTVALVYDFKRSHDRLNWAGLFHGLDMQLPIYLLALDGAPFAGQTIRRGIGALLFRLEKPMQRLHLGEQAVDRVFSRKTRGLFDGGYASDLDPTCEKGYSRYIAFYMGKEGAPYGCAAWSSALPPDTFNQLLDHTRKTILSQTEQMMQGQITVQPYRLGQQSPCQLCDFQPLCKFDWQINDVRVLENLTKTDVLKRWEEAPHV